MVGKYTVSLVIPCRNEELSLQILLPKIPKTVDEVIVVNNLSSDNSAKIATKYKAKLLQENRTINGIGYGFALKKGIKAAKGDIIACLDADGSYPVTEIPKIIENLEKNQLDFISCNRLPVKNRNDRSTIRSLGVMVLNILILFLYHYPIKDSLSGMWVFRRSTLKKLQLSQGGWHFSEEIKLEAINHPEVKFAEYHINYKDRRLGSSKLNIFLTGITSIVYILRKRISYRAIVNAQTFLTPDFFKT